MNRIKELRKRDNVKQADLAKSVNVSQAALSGYETGKYEADTDTYRRIANYFDVSLDYLLGGQPATPARPGPRPRGSWHPHRRDRGGHRLGGHQR